MSFKDLLCQSSQTFDFVFGIVFSGLLVLVFVSIIVVVVICVDNRRRKRIYKHKYRRYLTKESASAKVLSRILTYMAYKLKNGQLTPSMENAKPPQNAVALLTDTGMNEHRNRAAANIVYFFAAEPRTKTVVVASPPSTTPIGSPKSSLEPSPAASLQQSYIVSPRQQPILVSSITTTGTGSTTSIQSRGKQFYWEQFALNIYLTVFRMNRICFRFSSNRGSRIAKRET